MAVQQNLATLVIPSAYRQPLSRPETWFGTTEYLHCGAFDFGVAYWYLWFLSLYIYIYQLYIKLDNSIGSTQKKRLQNPAVCCVLLGPVGDCWLCNPIVSHYSAYSIKFHYL